MIFTVFTILASAFALSYRKGETFSYHFHNSVDTATGADPDATYVTNIAVDLNATFTVQSIVADGAYLKLVVSNVALAITDSDGTETIGPNDKMDELVAAPLYFKMRKNGTITDVVSSKNDTSELVNIKTAVAFALRTNLQADLEADYQEVTVIDPMGKHTEYTTVGRRGNSITVDSYFSDADFVGFSDKNIKKGDVSVESQSTHVITDEKITSASATTTVVLVKESDGSRANGEEQTFEDVPIAVTGSYVLSDYTQMEDSTAENAEIASMAKFLSQNRGYGMIPSLRDSYYPTTFSSLETTVAAAIASCPSACNLCQSRSASTLGGNTNLGFRAYASAVVGVQKGCTAAKRSYIVGAYLNLDLYVCGYTISALDAYAEYGQLNGSQQRNGAGVSLFGWSVASQKFTALDCRSKTITVFNSSKNASFTYRIPVFCLTLQLTAGVTLAMSADINFQICPNQFTASMTFQPTVSVTLSGKASLSAGLAKATLELSGSLSDYIDPTAYVDGNTCRIGIRASNYLSSINLKLQAYFEILDWTKIWSSEEKYKSGKKWNIYEAPLTRAVRTQLIDLYWS